MVIFLLLLASIAAYVIVMLGMGSLGKNVFQTTRDRLLFQIVRNAMCVVIMVAFTLLLGHSLLPSGFVLLLAGAMGAAQLLSSVSSLACFKYGPVSISILIYSSMSMLISALAGPVFWHESISFFQIVGIFLSVLSMTLLTEKSPEKKTSFMWVICLILAAVGGGMQGPIQKVLTTSAYAAENMEFITYSFVFSTVASVITFFLIAGVKKNGSDGSVTYRIRGKVFWLFVSQAALSVFLNINNLKLVKELPTVIFFPAYNIGGLLITTIASRFLFREKMNGRQTAGFIVGLFALLLISGTLEKLFDLCF